jgi:KEOPS complex subunit Cgi121
VDGSLVKIWKFDEYGKYFIFYSFRVCESLKADSLLERLRNVSTDLDVQMVDLDKVAGMKHLYFAVLNAVHAFERGTNISRSLAMEFLLYVSAQKQISEAIKVMGVGQQTRNVVIVAVGENEHSVAEFAETLPVFVGVESDEGLPDRWDHEKVSKLLSLFKISDKELDAMQGKKASREQTIQKLILERMALLSTVG